MRLRVQRLALSVLSVSCLTQLKTLGQGMSRFRVWGLGNSALGFGCIAGQRLAQLENLGRGGGGEGAAVGFRVLGFRVERLGLIAFSAVSALRSPNTCRRGWRGSRRLGGCHGDTLPSVCAHTAPESVQQASCGAAAVRCRSSWRPSLASDACITRTGGRCVQGSECNGGSEGSGACTRKAGAAAPAGAPLTGVSMETAPWRLKTEVMAAKACTGGGAQGGEGGRGGRTTFTYGVVLGLGHGGRVCGCGCVSRCSP